MSALIIAGTRGSIEMAVGEHELAEEILRNGWDGLGEVGERGIRSTIGGYLGEVLARLGRLDEAEALLDEAMGISTLDDWVTVSQVRIGRAFVASGRSEHDRACELAREAVEIVDAREYLTMQQEIRLRNGEILLAAGRNDEARAALERAREVAERKGLDGPRRAGGRPPRRARMLGRRSRPYTEPMQEVLDVSNAVAAELAGMGDGVLDALRDRLGCTIRLRGNQLTLEGDDEQVGEAREVIDELVELVEGGHQIGAQTVDAVLGALEGEPRRPRGVRRRRLAPPRQADRAEDGHPEGLRRRDPPLDDDVRDRARRHRQDLPRDGARRRRAPGAPGRADHPHAPRGRGRRAARLPAGRHARQGRPVPAPALRRALRHARPGAREHLHGARHDRGRAAGLHARPDPERQLHHPRRGAEHLAGADADVPDAARLRLEGRRHGRRDAGRPAARPALRPDPGAGRSSTGSTGSRSSSSTIATSCGTSSSSEIVEAYREHAEETGTGRSR